jgi:hypothetical protein
MKKSSRLKMIFPDSQPFAQASGEPYKLKMIQYKGKNEI